MFSIANVSCYTIDKASTAYHKVLNIQWNHWHILYVHIKVFLL